MNDEAPDKQTQNRYRYQQGEGAGEPKINSAEETVGRKEAKTKTSGKVIERNKGEDAKPPEYEGVGQAWAAGAVNHFCLAHYFPEEIPNSLSEIAKIEIRVSLRRSNPRNYLTESRPETCQRSNDEDRQKRHLKAREMGGLRIAESE